MESKMEADLTEALKLIRDFRATVLRKNLNSWAVRQALVTALIFDYDAAVEQGIKDAEIRTFDKKAVEYAKEVLKLKGHLQ